MAIISEQAYIADGTQREFQVVGTILSDSHIGVWIVDYSTTPVTETRLPTAHYDVLGSTVLLDVPPQTGLTVSLVLTDNGEGIEIPPSEITDISANINKIINVSDNIEHIVTNSDNMQSIIDTASIKDEVVDVADIKTQVVSIFNDKIKLDSIYNDKAKLDSIFADKTTLDSIFADKLTLDTLYSMKEKLNSLYADKNTLDSLYAYKTELDSIYANLNSIISIYENIDDVNYFADRYLGDRNIKPTTRLDGSSLLEGDLYFDKTIQLMRVYSNDGWKVAYASTDSYTKAEIENLFVGVSGDQVIEDIKTFTSSPIVPTPTTGTQVANKLYVDNQTVDNILELKTIDTTIHTNVNVLGYYTKGDGGGGLFYWDSVSTENENGGTIIQATGVITGRWKRVFSGSVNVKWFGAKGDGVADDTLAIQNALDSVPNSPNSYAPSKLNGGGGRITIEIPSGDYKVSSVLDMSQRDYTIIKCDGRATIYSSSTTYIIDMASSDHCEIHGIALYSNTARVGIYINRCTSNPFAMFNTISDCSITLTTDTTANGGSGRIGIYNNRGEQNIFQNLVLRCDVPYWAQNMADSNFPPTYGTQNTSIYSATVNTHIQCNFIANGTHSPAMVLDKTIGFEFINCYWSRDSQTTGIQDYAVSANNISRCVFTGSVEVSARFMLVVGIAYSIYTDIIMQVDALDAGGVFNLDDTGGTNGISVSQLKVLVAGGTPVVGACIIKDSNIAPGININGNSIETTSLMIPISSGLGTGRLISNNFIKRDNTISLSNPSLSGGTINSSAINDSSIGATVRNSGKFTTVEANNNLTVSNTYASIISDLNGVSDAKITFKGTPDGTYYEHAKVYMGRDTEDGWTYGSYLGFYTEGKNSGASDTSVEVGRWTAKGHLRPTSDNLQSLGKASNRWSNIYAGTGTINTSDDRLKTYIDITEVEKQVAKELKGLIKKFKFNDAIESKGIDKARIHYGTSAQSVVEVFEKYGLDAMDYAMVCYDEWQDQFETRVIVEEVIDENGDIIQEEETETVLIIKAGNRYGLRYEELLCFIMSAL